MIYRDATPDDVAAIDTLFRQSFTTTFGHLYAPADLSAFLGGFTPDAWRDELAQDGLAIRLAERDRRLVGFAKVGDATLPIARRGRTAELRQLYLAEEAKGTGVAAALMDWVMARARDAGAVDLVLSVYVDNHRARRFYQRYGFVDAGPYRFMVGSHADEDRMMRLAL